MFKKNFWTAIAASFLFVISSGASAGDPALVGSNYHTGYLPDGFDTNDHVQLVGEGVFNNSCYRPARVDVEVDHDSRTILVESKAYLYSGYCLQVLVPYHQVIDVGMLKAGRYQVLDKSEFKKMGDLNVRVATNAGADDFLYAPVSQAYVKSFGSGATLTLQGEFSNSCLKLVDVMIEVQPKVIVVRPIAEVENRADCVDGAFPFEVTKPISGLASGRYLLHVRSLNAKAINNLVDIQ